HQIYTLSLHDALPISDQVYLAYIKNNNVYVRKKTDLKSEKQMTFDGSPGLYYSARIDWSPDSKKLSTTKVRKAEVRQLTLLESSDRKSTRLNSSHVKI